MYYYCKYLLQLPHLFCENNCYTITLSVFSLPWGFGHGILVSSERFSFQMFVFHKISVWKKKKPPVLTNLNYFIKYNIYPLINFMVMTASGSSLVQCLNSCFRVSYTHILHICVPIKRKPWLRGCKHRIRP